MISKCPACRGTFDASAYYDDEGSCSHSFHNPSKPPSSPEGDCFPYSPTSMAAAVGYVAEDKKPTQPLDENQLWGSPAGETADDRLEKFIKGKLDEMFPEPEPLGADISGPKGSGGAAPGCICHEGSGSVGALRPCPVHGKSAAPPAASRTGFEESVSASCSVTPYDSRASRPR